MKLVIQFDGGCSTQKGIAAGAAVLIDEEGAELAWGARFLQGVTTPMAEYTGLHVGLELAAAYAGSQASQASILALGDSELVIRQINRTYRCRLVHLQLMLNFTDVLMRPFAAVEVREFPKAGPKNKRRFGNARADHIAGVCMDLGRDIHSSKEEPCSETP